MRWGHARKDRARLCEKQGGGSTPSTRTHISVTLSADAAQGRVFKIHTPRLCDPAKSLNLSLSLSLLHRKMRIVLASAWWELNKLIFAKPLARGDARTKCSLGVS